MKCEDIQIRLKAFLSNDLDAQNKIEIKNHLNNCEDCSRNLEELKSLSEIVQTWKGIEPSPWMFEKVKSQIKEDDSHSRRVFKSSFVRKAAFRFAEVAVIVVLVLLFSHVLQKPATVTKDDYTSTISLYLTEHQEAVIQTVSQESSTPSGARISVHRDDILYFEHIDALSSRARPGIIFRGAERSSEEFSPSGAPPISKGEVLTLAEAQNAVDFELVAPARFHPGYILESIRKIEDFDSFHLVYTNGIDTISMFEQPLDGEGGLAAQDFREFAVYQSIEPSTDDVKAQDKATILAWSNGSISFVLIGKMDMSRLMEMAQSISKMKKDNLQSHE